MTLLEALHDATLFGFTVSFRREPMNIAITVKHEEHGEKESWLPDSHWYESKVIDCIDFMKQELTNKTDKPNESKS